MDSGKRVGPEAAFNANSSVEKSERAMESSSTGMGSKMKPLKPVTKFARTAKSKIIKLGPNRSTMYVASPPCIPVGCYEPAIKTHLCTDYDTAPIGCKLGDKCHFAHGICEIGKPVFLTFDNDNPCSLASGRFAGELRLPCSPPPAKFSVDASLDGSVIGYDLKNMLCKVKPSHESSPNLRIIELQGELRQLEIASCMVIKQGGCIREI